MSSTKNFLISYSQRVGSTALVDILKKVPGVIVPVFEELDWWYVDENRLFETHNAEKIADVVAGVFYSAKIAGATSVGFKWRIWGDLVRVSEVLKSNNVTVFNLVRADALELTSSLYLTDVINSDRNSVQFSLKDAVGDDERLKILFKYRMQMHPIDIDRFFALLDDQIATEQRRIEMLRQLQLLGVSIQTIFYEDFAYKRHRFLTSMLAHLGLPPLGSWPNITLRKVSGAYPSEQFTNREELFQSPRLIEAMRRWDAIISPTEFQILAL